MKVQNKSYNFILSPSSVDEISEVIQNYYNGLKVEHRVVTACRLSVEEILLQWLDKFGEGIPITLNTGKKFGKTIISLEIEGQEFDPLRENKENIGGFSAGMLKSLGLNPDYSYLGGKNIFSFKLKKKQRNPIINLLFSLCAALVIGFAGLLLPSGIRETILNNILIPINNTFLNILGCAAGPMIFLSVAWGIYGIGDTTTLSRIGRKMILSFLSTLTLVVLISGSLMLLFFRLDFSGGAGNAAEIQSIFQIILDIFPKNIFSPFIDGNTLQIIFLGFLIGIAMLFLGKRTEIVALAVEQINYIVQFLVEFISRLVPYFIIVVVVRFIWADTISTMLGLTKLLFVFIGIILLTAGSLVLITSLRHKIHPLLLVKKGLTTFLIAFTTASSAASFGTNMKTCEKRYGIDSSITSFGIPLGMVMYKPATALGFFGFAVFFAETYQVPCSVSWLLMAFFIVIVIAIATPPIPGGSLTAYTIIFSLLGIPAEGLAIALAMDVVVDFIETGFNQFLLPFNLINQSSRIGKIDTDTLRKNN